MKASVIIPIFNSHGAVVRQAKYFQNMCLPDDVEFIFVDDGSDPPIKSLDLNLNNLTVLETNDKRPWTQGLARNMGAKHAKGTYLLMTDIDHILSEKVIQAVREFTGGKMVFYRFIAVISPEGHLQQDIPTLVEYGYDPTRAAALNAGTHGNTFAMKADLFWAIGGYDPRRCQYGYHAQKKRGEDCYLNRRWSRYSNEHGIKTTLGPDIYVFPVGKFNITGNPNPKGLFHGLSYEVPEA